MLPDRVSNLGPLTYESSALPIALRGRLKAKITVIQSWNNSTERFLQFYSLMF